MTEEEILKFWEENRIFEKSVNKESSNGDFVFYDGPPFATGLPHYGHILASIIKDVVPRYQTMKGKRVPRRWGWDCHGLPIENLIEKDLKLKSKKDIEEYGVEKFNKAARDSVLQYADEWKKIIPRIGRWVDMENDYKTMDTNYTESVWWVFKTLYDKGLIYEGYKSMHICPRCETTLSNFEVTQNYKEIKDWSVIVKFEIEETSDVGGKTSDVENIFVLAWTTTPWTLPGNVALAVNPKIEYVKLKHENSFYILAKSHLEEIFKDKNYEILEEFKGKDLIGKKYKPLFNYYTEDKKLENQEKGWKIYGADFVSTEEGTGVVHIAPAFGEEDMNLGQKEKLPFIQHVTMDGKFKPKVKDFIGLNVKPKGNPRETDEKIVKWLEDKNKFFSKELITHSYPFCWRCDTPLLNYATSSWFVKVTAIKDKLIKINKKINWIPEHLRNGRFGKWLEGARDWAISRSRYWGAPLPVWRCKECRDIKVIGSTDEIREELNEINKLFIVRHGEAESNLNNILNGNLDKNHYSLTKRGKAQVEKTRNDFKDKKIDLIFSSPFLRAKETAELIADVLGLEVIIDDRLREVGVGQFEGKTVEEFGAKFSTKESRYEKADYGVESGKDVELRIKNFLDEINEKYKNKNIIVVSHGDPLQIFHSIAQGIKPLDAFDGWYPEKGSIKIVYSKPIDLHRPYIDKIEFKCSCGEKMSRVQEVFDCWFESGSMPYGQAHYPFAFTQNQKFGFPAEFIAEGVDQTRGWFYTLLVLSTALFDETSYKNVIANGIILAEDGQKMSKRLNNYPDPMRLVEKYGADALRFYLISSQAVRAENLNFSEKGVDEVNKKVVSKLKNVLSFYKMYVSNSNLKNQISNLYSENILDKWILARLNVLTKEVSVALDNYEIDKAARPIGEFVDDLSNWYVRRSRERFKDPLIISGQGASATLNHVLIELSKLIAPFMPFVAEEIYQNLKSQISNLKSKESVHLEEWPKLEKISEEDEKNLEIMIKAREITSIALEIRQKEGISIRQVSGSFSTTATSLPEEYINIVAKEINVKEIKTGASENKLDTIITPELKQEGIVRELIRKIQDLRKKEGLVPQQKVELVIETDKDGEKFINKFSEEIKRSTNLTSISFSSVSDVEEIKIEDLNLKIKIKK